MYELADQSWRARPTFMSSATLRQTATRIGDHARRHALPSVRIILHGGEPLLVGHDRFRVLCETLRAAVPDETRVALALQTNAVLIDEHWINAFDETGVTVAVSLDGPQAANDLHRTDRAGRSTHARAVRGIVMLRECLPSAFTGMLGVIDLRADPETVYRYLASFEPPLIDFNFPHATHDVPPRRHGMAAEYGKWLVRVFEAWAAGDRYRHSVRFFDHVIGLTIGLHNSVEYLGLAPVDLIVVEADGAIEGVDALKAAYDGAPDLGLNVFDHDFDDALRHPSVAARQSGLKELGAQCRNCSLVSVCGGGYLPHRYSAESGFSNPSVYCEDLAYVISHVQHRTGLAPKVA